MSSKLRTTAALSLLVGLLFATGCASLGAQSSSRQPDTVIGTLVTIYRVERLPKEVRASSTADSYRCSGSMEFSQTECQTSYGTTSTSPDGTTTEGSKRGRCACGDVVVLCDLAIRCDCIRGAERDGGAE